MAPIYVAFQKLAVEQSNLDFMMYGIQSGNISLIFIMH